MELVAAGGPASVARYRRQQIAEWLHHADKYIRAGRYLAADELIQKVKRLQPGNELAANCEDRIHFLVAQLSQRVGLESAIQIEVRRFIDALENRKTHQVNSYLLAAKKLIEDGELQEAREVVAKALALDPRNTYGRAMLRQLDDMRGPSTDGLERIEELHFRDFLLELWKHGTPGSEHDGLVASTQAALQISHARRMEILRGVKNQLYKEALKEIWNTGGLSAFDMATVEQLRSRFDVSWLDHAMIEATLLKEVRKNRVLANVLVVDSDDASLLRISRLLRSGSYAVIAAANVKEALKAIETVTPDLILSELAFTDGSLGFDLYGFIRDSTRTENMPMIFMSSSLDRTTQIICKKAGVDDFIAKPVDGELLLATITGLLMHRHPQPQAQ